MVSAQNEHIDILRNAIQMEVYGEDYFQKMSKWVKHPNTKSMFISLARQERRHIEVLREELTRIEGGGDWISPSSVKPGSSSSANREVFKGEAGGGPEMDSKAGELEAIKLAMDVEKRSIDYYRKAGAEVTGSNAQKVFSWLVGEEAGHLTILTAEYDNRSRSGFYFDTPEFSLEVM
ncbi:MAG TPA: ferritin family protein [Thermoplasmata archaeon]|nr:ferritin family protein [Thermoplasmata archaeon]